MTHDQRFVWLDFARGLQRPGTAAVAGTGLGLFISRSLIELHGGRLSIDSQPGAGTEVSVWLPANRLVGAA